MDVSGEQMDRYVAKALGDGNCAFNAFVLGLFEKIHQGIFDSEEAATTQNKILELIQEAYPEQPNESIWNWFKDHLKECNTENSLKNLQEKFAPLMRQKVIYILENDETKKKNYLELTLALLMAEFNKFLENKDDGQDDIFRKYKFIKEKFDEISKLRRIRYHKKNQILKWWNENGRNKFIEEMGKNGEWVGDLELKILAEYFGVDFDVVRNGKTWNLYHDCGALPSGSFSEYKIKKFSGYIIEGGPIDEPRRLYFRKINKQKLQYYAGLFLQKKTIILDQYKLILRLWDQHHKERPTITLINEYGLHWNCCANSDWLSQLRITHETPDPSTSQQLHMITLDNPSQSTFTYDGDDSSDEETHQINYRSRPLNEQYKIFKQSNLKLKQEHYSFLAFATGLKLLFSPEVNEMYYKKKKALGRHKINTKDEFATWIQESISAALHKCFHLTNFSDISEHIANKFSSENKSSIDNLISNLIDNPRCFFKQRHDDQIMFPRLKNTLEPLKQCIKKFIEDLQLDDIAIEKYKFRIKDLTENDEIYNALLNHFRDKLLLHNIITNSYDLILKNHRKKNNK